MNLYRTAQGPVVVKGDAAYPVSAGSWDALVNRDDLERYLEQQAAKTKPLPGFSLQDGNVLAPIGSQEVWAAGVTYYRSRDARMEESEVAGGGSFYDRVYTAPRPELFYKASPHRVVGPGQAVRIRKDSQWNVPEPELALVVTSGAKIVGYTIGNDMSSRDIEGENPLYLPQAKVYDACCALGPGILVTSKPLPKTTQIAITIARRGENCFDGATTLAELKRTPEELVGYLYRESSFPTGCILLTGTGIIPSGSFTLEPGDEISISIDGIGTLTNTVERR